MSGLALAWAVLALAWAVLALAALPAVLATVNLALYRAPRPAGGGTPDVSVIVPARNEEAAIEALLDSVLSQQGVELELVIVDDASTDRTPALVLARAVADPRVRLVSAPPLPSGWNGKQHACATGAAAARRATLVFLDADVRLTQPDALARLAAERARLGADLLSGVPRQLTGTWMEAAVLPLIHFVLLGYLPLPLARAFRGAAFAAGCGQIFVTTRGAYDLAGGHGAVRGSRHDGVQLPRAYRRAGLVTDLADVAGLASCRMYRGAREVWRGLLKNAGEGMASPGAILPWTLLLAGGHVLPLPLLAAALAGAPLPVLPLALATALSFATRLAQAARFRLSLGGAMLHPVGVALLVAIQWHALALRVLGRSVAWKGREEHVAA